jgi:diguanylate cyclase (GGDEF)-like protein/PAS domain S-box-containing protein
MKTSKQGFTLSTPMAAAIVALVCLLFVGFGIGREIAAREAELTSAQEDAANLARSLVQHADDSIELVDTAVIGIVQWVETEGFGAETTRRLREHFLVRKATMPRLRSLSLYGADGARVVTSGDGEPGRVSSSYDRDFFQHHLHSTERRAYIGPPIISRAGGQWLLTVSRRIDRADGSFAGVARGTIDVTYFAETYARYNLGEHGTLSLISRNGLILARAPHDPAYIGFDLSRFPLVRAAERHSFGTARYTSRLDGISRVAAFHRSDRIPVTVLVARAESEILAVWRQQAMQRMVVVLGLTVIVALLGCGLVRELSKRQNRVRALATKEASFRLLSEAASDMVTRINFDGTLAYVSPAAERVVGWAPEQLVGTEALAGLHDEDRPEIEALVGQMRRGKIDDIRLAYRSRHRTKGQVWLESSLTVTRDPETGRVDGVVAVSRDITEQKAMEAQLAELASRDGLTSLANRRQFDEQLQKERTRAARTGSPLALLMIDVDHFKAFNDTYGHPAGDACLQEVARALMAEAARPCDLVARYGGEEFAVLLPDTDLDGCRVVADRVRLAIEALAVPHSASATAPHVTVSIGGAIIDGLDTETQPEALVEAADRALYAAKAAGRNRARISAIIRPLPLSRQAQAS